MKPRIPKCSKFVYNTANCLDVAKVLSLFFATGKNESYRRQNQALLASLFTAKQTAVDVQSANHKRQLVG